MWIAYARTLNWRADDNGDEHAFLFETFFIKYRGALAGEALTLGFYLRPYARIIAA